MTFSNRKSSADTGCVFLVGAGPGDPGLITVRGMELIRQADVIVFDALANPKLLDAAPSACELIDAGKRAKRHKLTQDQTNALLADRALAGQMVVRLKGGDPYVFGRGSEEAIYLHERGVPVEVVPGITAAIAGPAYAGVPVTHRNVATTCTFVTGHETPDKSDTQVDYAALAGLIRHGGTVCFYMGMGRLTSITQQLIDLGCDAATPVAVVQWGTRAKQRSLRATLADVQEAVDRQGLGAPAIIVVGQVAALDQEALNWFERRPLFGQRVLVTRTRQQSSDLVSQLEARGASVLEAPTIAVEPTDDQAGVEKAVRSLDAADWLVLTSANGVDALADALFGLSLDARYLAGVQVAVVGDATAARLEHRLSVVADVKPERAVGDALADELLADHDLAGKRIVMFRADIARPGLEKRLTDAGALVTDVAAYHTRPVEALPEAVMDALENRQIDWLTFTSSSTVGNLISLLGDTTLLTNAKIASIGPKTSATIREHGLHVDVEADQHDVPGLVDALCHAVD